IGATPQIQATWFGLANVPATRALVERWWLDCSREDFEALKDPVAHEDDGGAQHRHDQSVLSCTVKSAQPAVPTWPWEDLFQPWLYVRDSWVPLEPVHALRRANPASLLDDLISQSSPEACRRNLESASLAFRLRATGSRIGHRLRDELVLARSVLK